MPREIIVSEVGPYHVKVGWSPERELQVGVEADGERSLFWLMFTGEKRERLGQELVEVLHLPQSTMQMTHTAIAELVLDTLDSAAMENYQGVWSDMDRHGVNKLIRILRRARDGAFGKDE